MGFTRPNVKSSEREALTTNRIRVDFTLVARSTDTHNHPACETRSDPIRWTSIPENGPRHAPSDSAGSLLLRLTCLAADFNVRSRHWSLPSPDEPEAGFRDTIERLCCFSLTSPMFSFVHPLLSTVFLVFFSLTTLCSPSNNPLCLNIRVSMSRTALSLSSFQQLWTNICLVE